MWGDGDWVEDGILVGKGHNECFTPTGERTEIIRLDPVGTVQHRIAFDDTRWGFYRVDHMDGCHFADARSCAAIRERVEALDLSWE